MPINGGNPFECIVCGMGIYIYEKEHQGFFDEKGWRYGTEITPTRYGLEQIDPCKTNAIDMPLPMYMWDGFARACKFPTLRCSFRANALIVMKSDGTKDLEKGFYLSGVTQ